MNIESEIIWRLGVAGIIFIVLAFFEAVFQKRKLRVEKNIRWTRNIFLIVFNNIIVRFLLPFTAVSVSIYVENNQIGLLNYSSIPFIFKVIVSIILLDLIIYLQHLSFHHVPLLWRLHKVHHIDQDIDVSTGLRFHPIEILISALIKISAVLIFGIPMFAIILFEIILNATSMFNHSNIKLPKTLDRIIRYVIVTPDMHRVHHSVIVSETNSNFSFNLSIWDKLFGTYKSQPIKGHKDMIIGLSEYQDSSKTGLIDILIVPFQGKK